MQGMCPNCQQRLPDTKVIYDEVMSASYRVHRLRDWWVLQTTRSWHSSTVYGDTRLCAACAARYARMVRLRTLGWKLANYGFLALIVAAIIYGGIVGGTPGLAHSPAAIYYGIPALLAIVAVLVGCVLIVAVRLMRRSTIRFLLREPASVEARTPA
jgi:hypothetical protein